MEDGSSQSGEPKHRAGIYENYENCKTATMMQFP